MGILKIGSHKIRLQGINAPELDEPYGKQAKWALHKLVKGQTITAQPNGEKSYDRIVAKCFLEDGRDLAAEMVKMELALDLPNYPDADYKHLETPASRKKLKWKPRKKMMKNGRNTAGKFTSGNSGRPKGARNKKTLAIESLLEGQAEALTQTAISKALEGDGLALRLCMERIAPAPKDKSVSFPLPEMTDAMDALRAASSVLTAVSEGELTPIEGTRVMGLIDSYRRTLELTEIEERLQALEEI